MYYCCQDDIGQWRVILYKGKPCNKDVIKSLDSRLRRTLGERVMGNNNNTAAKKHLGATDSQSDKEVGNILKYCVHLFILVLLLLYIFASIIIQTAMLQIYSRTFKPTLTMITYHDFPPILSTDSRSFLRKITIGSMFSICGARSCLICCIVVTKSG